jgi:hypothetical protein
MSAIRKVLAGGCGQRQVGHEEHGSNRYELIVDEFANLRLQFPIMETEFSTGIGACEGAREGYPVDNFF